ncbi:MAG: CpaD family pilus assembly protein [Caulobacteraceae bacterium]|nr:CpaD family pilus assembly protein [Caulobacteraceae bacterium]
MSRSPLVLIAATLLLGACAGAQGSGPTPLTPTSRFALQVESDLDRVALAVHESGLSANQTQALDDMVNRFVHHGAPVLRIEAPSGDDPVALDVAWRVKAALEARGVPADRLQLLTYLAPDPRAPVLVGFDTVRAAVPRCGTSWTNLGRTGANAGYANFGCAVNANLAAQIADPRDIVGPRPIAPSSAARRALVFDRYRSGTPTSATREPMVEGQRVSDAVN